MQRCLISCCVSASSFDLRLCELLYFACHPAAPLNQKILCIDRHIAVKSNSGPRPVVHSVPAEHFNKVILSRRTWHLYVINSDIFSAFSCGADTILLEVHPPVLSMLLFTTIFKLELSLFFIHNKIVREDFVLCPWNNGGGRHCTVLRFRKASPQLSPLVRVISFLMQKWKGETCPSRTIVIFSAYVIFYIFSAGYVRHRSCCYRDAARKSVGFWPDAVSRGLGS